MKPLSRDTEPASSAPVSTAISAIAHPIVTVPLGLFLLGLEAAGPRWGLISLAGGALPPVIIVLILRLVGVFGSIRIPSLTQRFRLLAATTIIEASAAGAYAILGAPQSLVIAQLAGTLSIVALAAVTTATRISLHVATLTTLLPCLVYVGGPIWVLGAITIPAVAVARVKCHAHTAHQVILATFIPPAITVTAILLFRVIAE